jgi:hypothetical protein
MYNQKFSIPVKTRHCFPKPLAGGSTPSSPFNPQTLGQLRHSELLSVRENQIEFRFLREPISVPS